MKDIKYTFVILLASSSAYAGISCLQEGPVEKFSLEMIQQLTPLKECPTDDELILKGVTAEYKKYFGNLPQVEQVVKGYKLKGSAKELALANKMLGAKPPKNWEASAKDCQSIQCAFEKLLNSKEAAMQVFNANAKSGYTLSLDQTINQNMTDQHWSAKEIRELDAALSKLPPELRQLPKLDEIDRLGDGLRKSGHGPNVAAFASPGISGFKEADLVVYDAGVRGLTSGKSPYDATSWPQEAVIHEICHHHDFKGLYATNYGNMTSEQKNSVFGGLSGWSEKTEKNGGSSWMHSTDAQFVSSYAATSPAEDYAESCMNYVLHPETLEKKAPKKYAYMKKNLFNGAEFKDRIWVKENKVDWPKLNELIADESGCQEGLIECSKNLKFETDGLFSMSIVTSTVKSENGTTISSYSSYGSAEGLIKNSECYKNMRAAKTKTIEEILVQEDNYCEKGGPRVIKKEVARICEKSEKSFLQTLDMASKVDVKPVVKECESARDFTYECIITKVMKDKNVPEALVQSTKNIISSKIPDRMKAIEGELNKTPSSLWLKACLDSMKEIEIYTMTDTKTGVPENMLRYGPADGNYSSDYLARFVWEGSTSKDANMLCSQKILEGLKEQDYKIPEAGNPVVLVTKTFKAELNSFEKDVLTKMKETTKKCLFKKCKIEKVTELVRVWEEQSPEKRSGMVDEDFIEDLVKKVQSY